MEGVSGSSWTIKKNKRKKKERYVIIVLTKLVSLTDEINLLFYHYHKLSLEVCLYFGEWD